PETHDGLLEDLGACADIPCCIQSQAAPDHRLATKGGWCGRVPGDGGECVCGLPVVSQIGLQLCLRHERGEVLLQLRPNETGNNHRTCCACSDCKSDSNEQSSGPLVSPKKPQMFLHHDVRVLATGKD